MVEFFGVMLMFRTGDFSLGGVDGVFCVIACSYYWIIVCTSCLFCCVGRLSYVWIMLLSTVLRGRLFLKLCVGSALNHLTVLWWARCAMLDMRIPLQTIWLTWLHFATVLCMCLFHVRSLLSHTPRSLKWSTDSTTLPFREMGPGLVDSLGTL